MLTRIAARVRGLLARRRAHGELDEELQFHIEQATDAYVARGWSPADARRQARIDLGGLVQAREATRAVRSLWLDTLWQDLRLHALRRQPLYAAACVLTLTLAVAAATASLAVVRTAFLDPLPYEDDGALVSILTSSDGRTTAVSAHVLEDLRAGDPPLVGIAAIRPTGVSWTGPSGVEPVVANVVSRSYFDTLGVHPIVGRVWSGEDTDAVILSWSFAARAFGSETDALGQQMTFDGRERRVVGVMARAFYAPYWSNVDVWTPLDMPALLADPVRARRTLTVVARRTSGTTPEDLEAYLTLFSTRQQALHPSVHAGQTWVAMPLRDELVGAAGPALLGTGAGAALLLLIVAANLAGLSAARAVGLRPQTAVKHALGASRWRVLQERIVESAVLSLAGSAFGVWLAGVLVTAVAAYQAEFLPRLAAVTLSASTSLAGAAVGCAAGVVAGALPHLTGRPGAGDPLRASRSSTGDAGATRLRATLVVVQTALALVLIVGAGLIVRTVNHLSAMPLGFQSDRLTTFFVNLSGPRYASQAAQVQFERDVLKSLTRVARVETATASVGVPVIGGMGAGLWVAGRGENQAPEEIHYMSVEPGFMQVLGMRLVDGRLLQDTDGASAPRVMVVNETMARAFWPEGQAIGARVHVGAAAPTGEWMTVVGVVADVRQNGPTEAVLPTAFGSTRQYSWPRRYLTVRSDSASAPSADDLRAAVREVDPGLAIGAITPIDDLVSNRMARHRLVMFVLACFGGVATVLCALGLYAVLALTSALRRREYAIRLALGAPRERVRRLVVRQAVRLVSAGAAGGVLASAAGTRALSGLLQGVTPLDGLTFASAVVALIAIGAVAAWVPARRAGRIQPLEALKGDEIAC